MNYEQYADAMNAHADGCKQCDFARKTGRTEGACEVAKGIIEEWKASPKSDEDMFYATMNRITHEMKQDGITDEPQD